MSVAGAPRAGWYPDPTGRARLRWWDGSDWTDAFRAPPTASELARTAAVRSVAPDSAAVPGRGLSRAEMDEMVAEVRQITRREVDRAADAFQQRATAAARELQPLITEYTSRLLRWLRIVAVVAVVALIGWIVFSAVAEVTLWEWLGDRIDALTD